MIHLIHFLSWTNAALSTFKTQRAVSERLLFLFPERSGYWRVTHEFMFRLDSAAFLPDRFIIAIKTDLSVS